MRRTNSQGACLADASESSGNASESKIPLPTGWSGHVRAAVLHVISLAQYATAFTRSWAADSSNARMRLRAENDRLKEELGQLREVMRIKDRRLARIDPRRRPHYPPAERLAILQLKAACRLVAGANGASLPGHARDRRFLDAAARRRRPGRPRPNPHAGQSVPGLRGVPGSTASSPLPDDGQAEARSNAGPCRAAPGHHDRRADAQEQPQATDHL